MANFIDPLPRRPLPYIDCRRAAFHLGFALPIILGVGALVAGVLAHYQIAFFGAMGTVGSQVCLYGGAGLAGSFLLTRLVIALVQKFRQNPPPVNDVNEPGDPEKSDSDTSEVQYSPRSRAHSTSSSEADEEKDAPMALPNNLPPQTSSHNSSPIDPEAIDALKKYDSVASARLESIRDFNAISQEDFLNVSRGFIKGESGFSSAQHLEILLQERDYYLDLIKKDKRTPQKTVVVGGGPAGLTAALEAFLAGGIVHIVEKRSTYSRDTMFRLNTDVAHYLQKRLGHLYTIALDKEILKKRGTGYFERELFGIYDFIIIETKDLEFLLALLLHELAKKRPEGLKIYREQEVTQIVESKGKTYVALTSHSDEETFIQADWVVGADGMKSKVREFSGISWTPISKKAPSAVITFTNLWGNNAANEDLQDFIPEAIRRASKEDKFQSSRYEIARRTIKGAIRPHIQSVKWREQKDERYERMEKARHSVVVIQEEKEIKVEFQAEVDLAVRGGDLVQADLEKFGWHMKRLPSNRLFTSTHTIYVGTEIPKELLHKKEELLKWFRKTLEQNLPKEAIDLLLPQMRHITSFEAQLFRAGATIKEVGSVKIFLVGDSTGTPHFQTGEGAAKAIEDAIAFGKIAREWAEHKYVLSEYHNKKGLERTDALQKKAFEHGFAERL